MKKNSATFFAHTARKPSDQFGFVNMPPVRGSTVEFPNLAAIDNRTERYGYGRVGNPSSDALESLVSEMESGAVTRLAPSGLQAITMAILSVVRAGSKILISDSCYEPTRLFANDTLKRMGVEPIYFDPRLGGKIAELINEDISAVLIESPGSLTLEVQDLPAIALARGTRDIPIIVDNTWATPLFYQPLALGADIVVHSATKYFSGHSDVSLGTITANERFGPSVVKMNRLFGGCASPDDIYLVLRGMKTLHARMQAHSTSSIELANWFSQNDLVSEVLHPALAVHPDHAIFRRDFKGSGSVFTVELTPAPRAALAALIDDLKLFGLGYSYGGFESLVLAPQPKGARTAVPYEREGNLLRIHVGAEHLEDLKDDLAAGLDRYRHAMSI